MLIQYRKLLGVLKSIFGLQHYDRVAAKNHHPDVVPVAGFGKLEGLIQDQIHEGIKSP